MMTVQLQPSPERQTFVRSLLEKHRLDIVLVYGTRKESSFVQWLTAAKPRHFHYFYLTTDNQGFLEIDYCVPTLRQQTQESIQPVIEDLIERDLALFLKSYKRIGILGPVPITHLTQVLGKKEFVMLNEEVYPEMVGRTPEELTRIRASARVVTDAFEQVRGGIIAGTTEREIGQHLRVMLLEHADDLAFPITVMSGNRLHESTAGPPTGRAFVEGDMVCIDAGAILNGFASDCTRMYQVGDSPNWRSYQDLCDAHHAVIKRLELGMPIGKIPPLYAEELSARGLPADTLEVGDLGHAIAYTVHEYPFIYREEYESYTLVEGMVFTLEPEIVVSSMRLRVEDMIVMKNGRPRILTI